MEDNEFGKQMDNLLPRCIQGRILLLHKELSLLYSYNSHSCNSGENEVKYGLWHTNQRKDIQMHVKGRDAHIFHLLFLALSFAKTAVTCMFLTLFVRTAVITKDNKLSKKQQSVKQHEDVARPTTQKKTTADPRTF